LALLFTYANAQVKGLWYWTWSGGVNQGGTNLAIAFSGITDPGSAISNSAGTKAKLAGQKYLGLGGGNAAGRWSASIISSVTSYCNGKKFGGYTGIAFDIEEGDSGLGGAFINAFRACKNNGYKVLVTVSHSTPYGIGDGTALMRTFFSNSGLIDYMSPQLYTSGNEGSNDYTTNGVAWSEYKAFSGKLIPSIVTGSLYGNAQSTFKNYGATTVGYVQWSQTVTGSSGGSSPPSKSVSSVRCGSNWASANSGCGKKCVTNADCPGSSCYNGLQTNCPASAVAGSSSTFDGQSAASGALEPAAIGIIVAGCLIAVVMIVIVAVVLLKANKRVESV